GRLHYTPYRRGKDEAAAHLSHSIKWKKTLGYTVSAWQNPHAHAGWAPMPLVALALWICLPASALRIVTTSPQTTELVFQLGLGDHIVGVSAGSHYPDAAKNLPTIGELFAPSLEKTVALRPDCVVL